MYPLLLRNKGGNWNRILRNNRISFIGDSITIAGSNADYSIKNSGDACGSFRGWSLILPKTTESISTGKLMWAPTAAMTNQTIAGIKNTYLPQILALDPSPGICCVLAGSNDLGALDLPNNIADLRSIYDQLLAAKILPISCAVPTNDALRDHCFELNSAITALALEMDLPFCDFFESTDDGSTGWIAGYSYDGTHPTVTGAKVMGQLVRDTIDPHLLNETPTLITTANEGSLSGVHWLNGTMMDDTDTDGLPDGGSPAQVTNSWEVQTGGADTTFSLVTEAGVVSGKWLRINKAAYTADLAMRNREVANNYFDYVDGHHEASAFLIKVDAVGGIDTNINFVGHRWSNAGVTSFSMSLIGITGPIAPFVFYKPYTVPAGFGTFRMAIGITNNTADVSIGQLTLRDLDV
jgi:lysophospholipase L1-like esterase